MDLDGLLKEIHRYLDQVFGQVVFEDEYGGGSDSFNTEMYEVDVSRWESMLAQIDNTLVSAKMTAAGKKQPNYLDNPQRLFSAQIRVLQVHPGTKKKERVSESTFKALHLQLSNLHKFAIESIHRLIGMGLGVGLIPFKERLDNIVIRMTKSEPTLSNTQFLFDLALLYKQGMRLLSTSLQGPMIDYVHNGFSKGIAKVAASNEKDQILKKPKGQLSVKDKSLDDSIDSHLEIILHLFTAIYAIHADDPPRMSSVIDLLLQLYLESSAESFDRKVKVELIRAVATMIKDPGSGIFHSRYFSICLAILKEVTHAEALEDAEIGRICQEAWEAADLLLMPRRPRPVLGEEARRRIEQSELAADEEQLRRKRMKPEDALPIKEEAVLPKFVIQFEKESVIWNEKIMKNNNADDADNSTSKTDVAEKTFNHATEMLKEADDTALNLEKQIVEVASLPITQSINHFQDSTKDQDDDDDLPELCIDGPDE